MRNAEEHKKLLAQIAELESKSVNYFDVEKEFFLIDSNNLAEVKTRFYGYSIQATGIYEEDNLTEDAIKNLDGRGCYVYVEVKDGKITIKQDLNGSWGIYLFRHGDYFALSNSFFRLLDHVKFKYPLTVNRDYCHHMLLMDLCSHSCLETAINEVRLVERNVIFHIDVSKKSCQTDFIDYKENSISPDSEKGIATLDKWFNFWCNVFRGVDKNAKFIQADLSGGFDTRIPFLLLLNSGIDLNKVQIHSVKSEFHTYKEDYDIASQITEYYGLKLNQPLPERKFLNYSFTDTSNIDFYHRQTFEKTPFMGTKKGTEKLYCVNGYGGETIRGNWLRFTSVEGYYQGQINRSRLYSLSLSDELARSMETFLKSGFRMVSDKYKIEDQTSLYILQYFYHEARCRHHFGKYTLGSYFLNTITFSPALDPIIHTLRFDTPEYPDYKLLMALIFTRYEPDLLKFKFDSGRFIAPETIAYTQKINERFPRRFLSVKDNGGGVPFNLQPHDLQAEKILVEGKNNPNIPAGLLPKCLKARFDSSRTYGLFTAYFNSELYNYAADFYDTHIFGRSNSIYAIVGIARVLEDVEISQRNQPLYRDMQRFLEQDFATIHKETQIPDKFKPYISARVDIRLQTTKGEFNIVSVSDNKAAVLKPAWFNKGGIGYEIHSSAGELEIVAKPTVNGQVTLNLRGLWVPNPEDKSKLIPYWIDYTKLIVNDEIIFDKLTPAWHDKFYLHEIAAKANEEIKIQVEWLPHRSDT